MASWACTAAYLSREDEMQGLVDGRGGTENRDRENVCFPGSPGSFKWELLQESFSPLRLIEVLRKGSMKLL